MKSASPSRSAGGQPPKVGRHRSPRDRCGRRNPRFRRHSSTESHRASSGRRSRTQASPHRSSISGCAAMTAGSRDVGDLVLHVTGRVEPLHGRPGTSPPRLRRAPATTGLAPSRLSAARSDRPRADRATDARGRARSAASTDSSHSSRRWPGSHIIRSRLMLSNPARRASSVCRPRARGAVQARQPPSSSSRNDWTPKLRRLTPAAR